MIGGFPSDQHHCRKDITTTIKALPSHSSIATRSTINIHKIAFYSATPNALNQQLYLYRQRLVRFSQSPLCPGSALLCQSTHRCVHLYTRSSINFSSKCVGHYKLRKRNIYTHTPYAIYSCTFVTKYLYKSSSFVKS